MLNHEVDWPCHELRDYRHDISADVYLMVKINRIVTKKKFREDHSESQIKNRNKNSKPNSNRSQLKTQDCGNPVLKLLLLTKKTRTPLTVKHGTVANCSTSKKFQNHNLGWEGEMSMGLGWGTSMGLEQGISTSLEWGINGRWEWASRWNGL